MAIQLRRMTDSEYDAYHSEAVAGYAANHVRAGSWPAAGALDRAAREYAALLPDGARTHEHHVCSAFDADTRVGMIWFGPKQYGTHRTACVYDLQIDSHLRGQGYGSAVLTAAEEVMRSAGFDTMDLHVFGDNTVARSLYLKLGYSERNVMMTKRLT